MGFAKDGNLYVPVIETLRPFGLHDVPHFRSHRDDSWRQEHYEWAEELKEHRRKLHALCEKDKDAQQDELELCAADRAYWATMWVNIEESRKLTGRDKGIHGNIPFTPFWYQIYMWDWMDEIIFNDEWPDDGFISKSRGLGISWAGMIYATHGWLFDHPFDPFFTSRVEDLVDKPNNKHALFYKFDYILQRLPGWMAPRLRKKIEHTHLNRLNPWNGNTLIGAATTKVAGVAGRGTFSWADETARVKEYALMHEALTGTTEHRIGCTTETWEFQTEWWDEWHAAYAIDSRSVIQLEWWFKPSWDKEWEKRERRRFAKNPEKFDQEYGRDPAAASSNLVYPFAKDAPIRRGRGYEREEDVLVGMDPGRKDLCAIAVCQPEYTAEGTKLIWVESFERSTMPAELYAHYLTGEPPRQGKEGEPADLCWGITTPRDHDAMAFFRQIPWERMMFFGDPAGYAQETATGKSVYQIIAVKSYELRMRQWERWSKGDLRGAPKWVRDRINAGKPLPEPDGVYFAVRWDKRDFESRRNAHREVLQKSEFADTAGAERIRQAHSQHRFNKSGTKHEHTDASNLVSACEFIATAVAVDLHRREEVDEETGYSTERPMIFDLAMEAVT